MEQARRGGVRASIGHQRVLNEQSDFENGPRLSAVGEAKGRQIVGGHPQPRIAGRTRREGEFHAFLGVGKAVLPAPGAHASVFSAPFVTFVEVEIERGASGVLPTKHVQREVFDVPGREVAHVAVGGHG